MSRSEVNNLESLPALPTESTLDMIFGDSAVRHGLKIFTPKQVLSLHLVDRSGTPYIRCRVSGKLRPAKAEEIVRQLSIERLIDAGGYPVTRMSVEVPIQMGSTVAAKKADIVVYANDQKTHPHIIVEVKKPKRRDGLDQLRSYMNATGVHYGAWINGNDEVVNLRSNPNRFEEILRLPRLGEDLDDVKKPIRKSDLKPLENLKEEIQYLENTVLANAGVTAFDEVFKLIFAKLYDEYTKAEDESVEFRVTTALPREQYRRLNALFAKACLEWPDIFASSERIELSPEALVAVASEFQTRRFFDANLDVIDAAFEYMINPEQKGDKGQYFTPRPVVKMCVKMINPLMREWVLDPACGPGGFLIHALNWVTEQEIRPRYKGSFDRKRFDYANSRLFGLDFDRRLARVAKATMLIAGDGRSNIYRVNSLDAREWLDRDDNLASSVVDGKFDVIMTNPPFAGTINQAEILGTYDLAYREDGGKKRRLSSVTRDILFVERCLRFLKPGGRMALVLPQGDLNTGTAEYMRRWLLEHCRLIAVVGIHGQTFRPFTNTKTSVILLQRWRQGQSRQGNYPVFMAVNRRPVKDSSGEYRYKRAPAGGFEVGADGRRIIDHDLDEIADAFVRFARENGIEWWP